MCACELVSAGVSVCMRVCVRDLAGVDVHNHGIVHETMHTYNLFHSEHFTQFMNHVLQLQSKGHTHDCI